MDKVSSKLNIPTPQRLLMDDHKNHIKYQSFEEERNDLTSYLELIDQELRKILESSDTLLTSIHLIADECESNLVDNCIIDVKDYFPGLSLHYIHLIGLPSSGWSTLRSVLRFGTALDCCSTISIRETSDIIRYLEKEHILSPTMNDIDYIIACDLIAAYSSTNSASQITHSNWPESVCSHRHRIIDIRSSLYKYIMLSDKRKLDQFDSYRTLNSIMNVLYSQYSYNYLLHLQQYNTNNTNNYMPTGGINNSMSSSNSGKDVIVVPASLVNITINNKQHCLERSIGAVGSHLSSMFSLPSTPKVPAWKWFSVPGQNYDLDNGSARGKLNSNNNTGMYMYTSSVYVYLLTTLYVLPYGINRLCINIHIILYSSPAAAFL